MSTTTLNPTANILPSIQVNVNYSELKDQIKDFLLHFKSSSSTAEYDHQIDDDVPMEKEIGAGPKYMALFQNVSNRQQSTIYIDLDDIKSYQDSINMEENLTQVHSSTLVEVIAKNTFHFRDLFSSVIDEIMPEPTIDISYKDDVLDVILHQRRLRNIRIEAETRDEFSTLGGEGETTTSANLFPPALTRRYCLYFRPLSSMHKAKPLAVRDVRGDNLGQLITVRGIVTRVSDVKPAVVVNAYTCDTCGYEIFQEVTTRSFSPLLECTSPQCKSNQHKGQLFMSTRASKFSAYQDAKVQELADQVPVGHIPRMLTVHVNGDLVRSLNPGDVVDIAGIYLPHPYTGFQALRAGLLTETYLEANHVRQHKRKYDELSITEEVEYKIEQIKSSGGAYDRLASSIAPEIFGLLDIKKALLLLLVGGVTKEMGDGMKIRGDINICLMGDPGVAKSQLLKSITKLAPRGVYTTGKGSSGVGLTAAVMKDPVTDEMVLEGGALVLADNGICCIDEFDKMEDQDRTAIHEVMEQQTISISKAGITTSLNARTSILAAANPLYGRYNPKISPHENINLPAALLSRFDVLFLLLDNPSREDDERLAQHVTYVHMYNKHPEMEFEPLDSVTIRQYISVARRFRPVVPKEVGDFVVQSYIKMRKESKTQEGSKRQFSHTTPRTLLGIMRLSQALARIRFDSVVKMDDVDEALRLLQVAKSSLYTEDDDVEFMSPESKIFELIKEIYTESERSGGGNSLSVSDLKRRVLGRGFQQAQFEKVLSDYDEAMLWQFSEDGEILYMHDMGGDEDVEME